MGAHVGQVVSLGLRIWCIPYGVYGSGSAVHDRRPMTVSFFARGWLPGCHDRIATFPSLGAGMVADQRPTLCDVLHQRDMQDTLCHLRQGFITSVFVMGSHLRMVSWFMTLRCTWCPHYGGVVPYRMALGAYGGVQPRPGMVLQVL